MSYFGKVPTTPLLPSEKTGLVNIQNTNEDPLERQVAAEEVGRPPDIKDSPKAGFTWYIFYTIQMTSILYITKGLYLLNPTIEVFHVTWSKAVISLVLLAIILNKNLYYINITSVDP